MKRIEVKAKPGEDVWVVSRDTVGTYRHHGPLCIDTIKVGDIATAYVFVGGPVGVAYEEDVFTDEIEAINAAREMNQGLKNEAILIARCNYYHAALAKAGFTDELIFRDMPEEARREVKSRTYKIANDVFTTDKTKGE